MEKYEKYGKNIFPCTEISPVNKITNICYWLLQGGIVLAVTTDLVLQAMDASLVSTVLAIPLV